MEDYSEQNKEKEAIEETLYLITIPGMAESIKKGMKVPVEKCSEDPAW